MKNTCTMKKNKLALLTLVCGAVLSACNMQPPGAQQGEGEAQSANTQAQPVKVMAIDYEVVDVEQNLTSTVVAFEETYLSPALQGRIRRVLVEVNDRVSKGQLLVEMDRTQLDQTRLQYQQLKTDLARMDTLLRHGSVTQQSFDQMEAQVETTRLILKNLEENTLLRAPYSGIITGKYFNDGELFSPTPNTPVGKAALVSMIQVDPVKLMVNLSEKYLPLVEKGMKASIRTDVYPGMEFEGTVFRIHPTVSSATRTFTAEIKVPNPGRKLTPGMFARVGLKRGVSEALVVPAIAVLQQTGTNQRFVMLHKDGQAHKVVVEIENRHDDLLEIASEEIKGGEELIYAGQGRLEDGTPVTVVTD